MSKNVRVVVPCHNSDLTIEKCISSIFDSRGIEFELYVTDDGNNAKLAILQNHYPMTVLKTTGGEGAGKARNHATAGFNGSVVVFIDSDVQIYHDTLEKLVTPIFENSAEATVGCYAKMRGENFFTDYKRFYLSYRYDNTSRYLANTFWSAICALDFKTFSGINGFKDCFAGAGPEDIDLGVELTRHGARILSVPEAKGIHLSEFNFVKLLGNDLKKGSEDIYIHLSAKVPLLNNRHVDRFEILAVILAWCLPLLFLMVFFLGPAPLLTILILYIAVRIKFVKRAFGNEDFWFKVRSFLMTYLLDLTRGIAVLKGIVLFILEIISSGKYKPFVNKTSS